MPLTSLRQTFLSSMQKLFTFLYLIAIACLLAGLFGIVHDQISYTISPEYYTKFKFVQFGLTESTLPERVQAGIVGFQASWWMGLFIGLLVGMVGFMHRGARRMFVITLRSFVLAVAFTLFVSLLGLAYGFTQTSSVNLAAYPDWFIPEGIVHLRQYLCVGYMHNASYLGGALAIVVAWAYHIGVRVRGR